MEYLRFETLLKPVITNGNKLVEVIGRSRSQ